jgi:7-carboxy-7-deazaguanine synthase
MKNMDYNKVQPIIEAYVCVQTEGSRAGRPHFLVRTTGCTHRCYFGEGGWCDSWYTSIHPEKGTWTLNAIKELFEANPQINHLMISGGSPTMHPELVDELINIAKNMRGMYVTIETEGSHFIETNYKIDLVSLSPKFLNSQPKLGTKTPAGKDVDQKMIDQHEKFRNKYDVIKKMLDYHLDYHFKPVVDRNEPFIWEQIEAFINLHNIPNDKVWVMPAGDTFNKLQPNYAYVMEECIKRGYNFTGRAHIVAYNDLRGV